MMCMFLNNLPVTKCRGVEELDVRDEPIPVLLLDANGLRQSGRTRAIHELTIRLLIRVGGPYFTGIHLDV